MSEETNRKPEIQDAEIILDHNNEPIGISIPEELENDGNYKLEVSNGNIDIIKDGEKISSIALSDEVPQEIYYSLAEQEDIALISDNGTVMVTAKLEVDKDSTKNVPSVLENEEIFPPEKEEENEDNIDFTLLNKLLKENKDDEAEVLLRKIMESYRKNNQFTPPENANDNILNDQTPEEFIANAATPREPLQPGDSINGHASSVASIGASQNEGRVKKIAKAVGGAAIPLVATMAVKMTISTALTAALGPAVAAIAVPALFAAYSTHKLVSNSKDKEGGFGKRLLETAKEHPVHAGIILGSMAVGIAARMGGLEPIADFLEDKIDAVMGADDAVSALPSEYADLNASELKEKAFELFNGRGGEEVDQAMALKLYEAAAEMGSEEAKVDLAYIQYHGLAGVDKDPAAAIAAMKEMGRTEWLGGQEIPELNGGAAHAHGVSRAHVGEVESTPGERLNDGNIAALYKGWEDYPAYPEGSYVDRQFEQRLSEAIQNGTTDAKTGIVTIDQLSNQIYYTHELDDGKIVTHLIEMDEYKGADFLDNAPVGLYDGALGYDVAELRNGMENMLDFAASQGGDPQTGVVIGFVNPEGDTAGASMDVHAFKDANGNIQMRIITDDYFQQNTDAVRAAAAQTRAIGAMGNPIVFSDHFESATEKLVNNTGKPLGEEFRPATAEVAEPVETERERLIREATEKYEYEVDEDGNLYREDEFGDIIYKADIPEDQPVGVHIAEGGEDSIFDEGEVVYTDPETGETRNYNIPGQNEGWDFDDDPEDDDWIWGRDEPTEEKPKAADTKFTAEEKSNSASRFAQANVNDGIGSRVNISPEGEKVIKETVEKTINDVKTGKMKI